MVYDFLGHLMIHPQKEKIVSYLLFILLRGPRRGAWFELYYEILNSEMREHEWKWSRRNRSRANIWSKFGVQLPWTTISPPVKGDYHVWSDTGSIRHGAVVCRIVNWKGLNAYSVTSPLNIWTKFGVWLPRTLGGWWSTLKRIKFCRIYYLFYCVDREGGGRGSNCNMKF